MEFFAVYIPPKGENDELKNQQKVFESMKDALTLFKSHKDARLKSFKSKTEAMSFAQYGKLQQNINVEGLKSPSSLPIAAEKSSFRSLSPQELVAFRKEIEQNHLSDVYQMMMENPRYLVNIAANMPTILKEGPRYNALHVAILSKHFNMCKLILQTIEKKQFVEMLYGSGADEVSTQEASLILLEAYLNMPNKPRHETPLHFASKLGLKEIIQLLLTYPLCKQKPNSEGLFPKDVICQRCPDATPELKKQISEILEEQYFVPVLRTVDNSAPAVIGEPFIGPNLPLNSSNSGAGAAADDALSPKMQVAAIAGPMDKEQATNFRRRWKTPPRVTNLKSPTSPLDSPIPNANPFISPIKFRGVNNGNNNNYVSTPIRPGRRLFEDQNGNNTEEHPPPPTSSQISTNNPQNPFAAKFFNEYRENLNNSVISNASDDCIDASPAFKERHVRLCDPEKGIETVGRELARNISIGWKEYWKFLDKFVDIASHEGLEMFDNFLKKREEQISPQEDSLSNIFNTLNLNEGTNFTPPRSKSCDALKNLLQSRSTPTNIDTSSSINNNNITNPNLSIEKALQVYAKRAVVALERTSDILDALDQELKKLTTIVLSYCEDARFTSVNFRRAHARYARLIRYYMMIETKNGDKILQKIRNSALDAANTVSDEVKCVVLKLSSNYAEKDAEESDPKYVASESECCVAWERESDCQCQFYRIQNAAEKLKKRRRQFRMNYWLQKTMDESNNPKLEESQIWEAREPSKIVNSTESEDDSREEDYFSCDSDLEFTEAESGSCYETPPESISDFGSVYENSDDWLNDELQEFYDNFIEGIKPTKVDFDVLNAIYQVSIDENQYPHVNKWKQAMLIQQSEIQQQQQKSAFIKSF